jgi:hypothetical protein
LFYSSGLLAELQTLFNGRFMKLLLDENLPKRLKTDFPTHEIFTVREQDWNGIKNGELMQLLI